MPHISQASGSLTPKIHANVDFNVLSDGYVGKDLHLTYEPVEITHSHVLTYLLRTCVYLFRHHNKNLDLVQAPFFNGLLSKVEIEGFEPSFSDDESDCCQSIPNNVIIIVLFATLTPPKIFVLKYRPKQQHGLMNEVGSFLP